MDLSQLKQFNPKKGEKYIFIENGRPAAVLMCYEDYAVEKEKEGNPANFNAEPPKKEEATKPMSFRGPEPNPKTESGIEPGEEDLTVEDLPF